jgi:hypothetical protein
VQKRGYTLDKVLELEQKKKLPMSPLLACIFLREIAVDRLFPSYLNEKEKISYHVNMAHISTANSGLNTAIDEFNIFTLRNGIESYDLKMEKETKTKTGIEKETEKETEKEQDMRKMNRKFEEESCEQMAADLAETLYIAMRLVVGYKDGNRSQEDERTLKGVNGFCEPKQKKGNELRKDDEGLRVMKTLCEDLVKDLVQSEHVIKKSLFSKSRLTYSPNFKSFDDVLQLHKEWEKKISMKIFELTKQGEEGTRTGIKHKVG